MEDYQGFRIIALDPSFSRSQALRLMQPYTAAALGVTAPDAARAPASGG